MFVMDYEMNYKTIGSEVSELFQGAQDTIYFDDARQIFTIVYHEGFNIGMTVDRLIDIL